MQLTQYRNTTEISDKQIQCANNIKMDEVGNVAAIFVAKLWKMLSVPETQYIISWGTNGRYFVIHDQVQFTTKLLPRYFKHRNMGSFVRQLNLYDFHKTGADSRRSSRLEYQHKFFHKDRADLLKFIKRKLKCTTKVEYSKEDREGLGVLTRQMEITKSKQDSAVKEMDMLHEENVTVLNELTKLHAQNNRQTKVLSKIIELLIPIVKGQREGTNSASTSSGSLERQGQAMLEMLRDPSDLPLSETEATTSNNQMQVYNKDSKFQLSEIHNFPDLKNFLHICNNDSGTDSNDEVSSTVDILEATAIKNENIDNVESSNNYDDDMDLVIDSNCDIGPLSDFLMGDDESEIPGGLPQW